jgi:hypothetical protein
LAKIRRRLDDSGCFDAGADYLAAQAEDIGGVVFAVGVRLAFYLLLIDDQVERGAGAQTVFAKASGGMPARVRDSLS